MDKMQTREQMLFDLERKAYLDLIAQARADGERAGRAAALEEAAKYHDAKALAHREQADDACATLGHRSHHATVAIQHEVDATAIRALIEVNA